MCKAWELEYLLVPVLTLCELGHNIEFLRTSISSSENWGNGWGRLESGGGGVRGLQDVIDVWFV